MASRPTGVTVLAVLAAIGGIFGVLAGLGLLGLGSLVAASTGLGGLALIIGLLILVIGVAELALAYGFWNLRPWAWQYGLLLAVLSVVLNVIELVLGYTSFTSVIVSLVISGIIVYYLNTPDVRRAFGAPATGWPWIGGS
jgi:hypothetical protein